ncbi:hypothetical protein V1478_015220 [Vespula squamosa]|uniref:Oxidoreductase-like domain-containing protein n=1 Tax=Vespula squamosa TaxID=30214 RepID=A0ABD2A592_VESSQ
MNLVRSKVNNVKKQTYDNWKSILMTLRLCSSDNQSTETSNERIEGQKKADDTLSIDEIEEPTNCCMSGCTNCVWIQYAEKLSNSLKVSNLDVQKEIMEKIQDPNMRAFLSMELRCRNLIK